MSSFAEQSQCTLLFSVSSPIANTRSVASAPPSTRKSQVPFYFNRTIILITRTFFIRSQSSDDGFRFSTKLIALHCLFFLVTLIFFIPILSVVIGQSRVLHSNRMLTLNSIFSAKCGATELVFSLIFDIRRSGLWNICSMKTFQSRFSCVICPQTTAHLIKSFRIEFLTVP